jgi:hypothetical protein
LLLCIIIIIITSLSFVASFFTLVLPPLNQQWSLQLRLQGSWCSASRDVPSTAVFCSEYIKCIPAMASKLFLKPFVAIPVVPIVNYIILHYRFHIRFISIHKRLHLSVFSASFCTIFLSADIVASIGIHIFYFVFLIITSCLFSVTS